MEANIVFYIQHLLGIGHIKRAATLTRGLVSHGHRVTFVSGGMPVPGIDVGGARFVQLPPVRATDIYFKRLVTENGHAVDERWKAVRAQLLMSVVDESKPDIFITELFPFGRRQLSFELMPVLEALHARKSRPLIVSSVRDILVQSPKRTRTEEMLTRVKSFYDLVLVHGDSELIPFEDTFPHAREIEDRLRYTGYVVDRPIASRHITERKEVVVSAGGGAVSEPLLEAALGARVRSVLHAAPWRFLVGHNLPEDRFENFSAGAGGDVIVERARPDFISLLRGAALSISQGGYNTVMEVLDAGTRAVVVPYAGGLETAQTLRARLLATRGALHVVEESSLSAETVAAGIDAAMAASAPELRLLDTNGVDTTIKLLAAGLREHRHQGIRAR